MCAGDHLHCLRVSDTGLSHHVHASVSKWLVQRAALVVASPQSPPIRTSFSLDPTHGAPELPRFM
jgi:hypothetical protein